MAAQLWSFVLAGLGLTGLYIAANRPRVGWWFNVGAQLIWFAYGIATTQWGFIITAIAYAFVYLRLLRRAYQPKPEDK